MNVAQFNRLPSVVGRTVITRRSLLKAAFGGMVGGAFAAVGGSAIQRLQPGLVEVPPVGAEDAALASFERTWARTDQPVAAGQVNRTWMWGPEAFSGGVSETYAEAPGGVRTVQYYDKARMEDSSWRSAEPPWDVTNGLLVVELITGLQQAGDSSFEEQSPAQINIAGDADDPTGPTYATFSGLLDAPPLPVGSTIIQRLSQDGTVTDDPGLAQYGVSVAVVDDVTNHAIAAPFWEFMGSSGVVYENGQFVVDALFENRYFATGRPITEAYWVNVKVGGVYKDVLIQCFERRCLTYTPDNPQGWQVEAGNVGRHYYNWRYGDTPPNDPPAEPPDGGVCPAGASTGSWSRQGVRQQSCGVTTETVEFSIPASLPRQSNSIEITFDYVLDNPCNYSDGYPVRIFLYDVEVYPDPEPIGERVTCMNSDQCPDAPNARNAGFDGGTGSPGGTLSVSWQGVPPNPGEYWVYVDVGRVGYNEGPTLNYFNPARLVICDES